MHRVKFSTEQVTKEMQGVWVEGMLVWSIMRNEDGPFKAFRNLGEDLTTGDPKTANDSLTSMANAIVRSAIANSTLSQMLREREELRVQIRKEMADVVQGWGVWLETVEITDVQIKSAPLFKDMQAPYREQLKQVSEVYKMKVGSEIKKIKDDRAHQLQLVKNKFALEKHEYKQNILLQLQEENLKHKDRCAVEENKLTQIVQEYEIFVDGA